MRSSPGVLRPFIVIQLLVVMMLAGVGASFALDSNAVVPTPTPGPTATPNSVDSLEPTKYVPVYNSALTQVIGITVTVRNKDADAAHSGTVNVAILIESDSITGQAAVTDLAAGATIQVIVNLGPIDIETYLNKLDKLRVFVTQTS